MGDQVPQVDQRNALRLWLLEAADAFQTLVKQSAGSMSAKLMQCTMYGWFRALARRFLFQTIQDVELMLDCEQAGRVANPTAAMIDSQTVNVPGAKERGQDAGERFVRRKRHITVDTDDCLLMVNLAPVNISDSVDAYMILEAISQRRP